LNSAPESTDDHRAAAIGWLHSGGEDAVVSATSVAGEIAEGAIDPAIPKEIGGVLDRTVERVPIRLLTGVSSPRTTGADDRHVRALAELDVPLPPVVVHRPTKRVLDGVHRIRAAELRGESDVEVRYFDGGEEEAFLLAVQLNSVHGKPLSVDDRTAAARRIIASHPHWSDRRIASVTCLSAKTVAVLRGCSTGDGPQSNKRVGLDGRARPLRPAEGRLHAGELLAQDPNLSLRELARRAGCPWRRRATYVNASSRAGRCCRPGCRPVNGRRAAGPDPAVMMTTTVRGARAPPAV
jgi:Predicted transcriptional regulators